MKAPRLYRVILPVLDIERAAEFYRELIATPGVRVSSGHHHFDCSGVILALYDPKSDGNRRAVRPNFEHVYVAVDDLEAVYERAARFGGTLNRNRRLFLNAEGLR